MKACKSSLRVSVSPDPAQFSPSDEKPGTTRTNLHLQGSSAKGNQVQCECASSGKDVTAVYTCARKDATRAPGPAHAYRCG